MVKKRVFDHLAFTSSDPLPHKISPKKHRFFQSLYTNKRAYGAHLYWFSFWFAFV